ncbi:Txe/YoeB family addiction module toxin [Odoribacter lunatus]|uniref:Txe/YoeB family addiction module toxin n=1 Tax=Odoribacter lunatus TaxID=2941335 RepID=UPI0020419F73|nr:Txe/YoeB family addiction module toxin [Odoribacter lunatus]
MEIRFTKEALDDLSYWKKIGNKQILSKIESLLVDIAEHPFSGIGKPEALRFELAGYWSRRINSEHRIVYRVENEQVVVIVISMRHHYKK